MVNQILKKAELELTDPFESLSITADGNFVFTSKLEAGDAYEVKVKTQPANATCSVTNGTGTVSDANIANFVVTCASQYTLGGTVTGLTGTLKLRDFDAPIYQKYVDIAADGAFVFPGTRRAGYDCQIDVIVQPSGQTCTLANDLGIVAGNVTNITVTCVTTPALTYSIGGTVAGIPPTEVVTLRLTYGVSNTTENFQVDWNPMMNPAPFDFLADLNTGEAYTVTVMTDPVSATCTVVSGNVGSANISNVTITCM